MRITPAEAKKNEPGREREEKLLFDDASRGGEEERGEGNWELTSESPACARMKREREEESGGGSEERTPEILTSA